MRCPLYFNVVSEVFPLIFRFTLLATAAGCCCLAPLLLAEMIFTRFADVALLFRCRRHAALFAAIDMIRVIYAC